LELRNARGHSPYVLLVFSCNGIDVIFLIKKLHLCHSKGHRYNFLITFMPLQENTRRTLEDILAFLIWNLLGHFVSFGLSQNFKGFGLGRFMTKPKSKVTDEGSIVTGPVPNSIVGTEFPKGLHWLETFFDDLRGWSSSAGDVVNDSDLFREG
jgi:hypothetical protein